MTIDSRPDQGGVAILVSSTIKKQIGNQVLTAELSGGRFLKFTAQPLPSTEATSTLFSSPAPTETIYTTLHATDLTLVGRLPKTDNKDFLDFITATLDRYGAKRLLAVDLANVAALEAKDYQVCQQTEMALVPYSHLRTNVMNLTAEKSKRTEDFLVLQKKLETGEWQFVYGYGNEFIKKINIAKLHEFYQQHCPFSRGGFKTQYDTYGQEGMIARFGYPDQAVMSFAIQTKDGELIAANHLLFAESEPGSVAYCYDNVVHEKLRSHTPDDSQHTYQFFLSQIASALAKEKREPGFISIILGAQGKAGNGQRLHQLLIGNHNKDNTNQNAPVLMFKGGDPLEFIITAIADEKAIAMRHLEACKQEQKEHDAEHQPARLTAY